MRRILRSLSIAKRLMLLTGLFGAGLALLGGIALDRQWAAMKQQQIDNLTAIVQVSIAQMDQWRIGAGGSPAAEAEAKRHALDMFTKLHYGTAGYLFVQSEEGVNLAHPNSKLIGLDNMKVPDSNGFYFMADVMPRVLRDGIATVEYTFPHLGETERATKIAVYAS